MTLGVSRTPRPTKKRLQKKSSNSQLEEEEGKEEVSLKSRKIRFCSKFKKRKKKKRKKKSKKYLSNGLSRAM